MKKRFLLLAVAGAVLSGVAAGVAIHPDGGVKDVASGAPVLIGLGAPGDVRSVLERSCQNCHSENTKWPWYSYVAPASWMLEHDVREARSHMNLSHWESMSEDEKQEALGEIAAVARTRQMPPRRYTLIHPEARLTDAEADRIYRWAREERQRSRVGRTAGPQPAAGPAVRGPGEAGPDGPSH
jgi:hypothetical protein